MTITRIAVGGLSLYVAQPNADGTPNLATVEVMTETSGTYSVTVADGAWAVYQQLGQDPASNDTLLSAGTMTSEQVQAAVEAALTAYGAAKSTEVATHISVGATGNITIE